MFFSSAKDLQDTMTLLNKIFCQFGLNINARKTATMILNFKGKNAAYPHSICTLNKINLENVKSFKYLGCQIEYNNSSVGKKELDSRINSAKAAFQRHKSLFRNFRVSLKTRIVFFNSFARSRLTYGCLCWPSDTTIGNRLDSATD